MFADVAPTSVHFHGVSCVARWEVTVGVTSSRFAPSAAVTRAQMATFLARMIEATGGSLPADAPDAFSDDDGSVHEESIDRLAAAGLVRGVAGGGFHPGATVRRDQMATFLARTAEHVTGSPLPAGPNAFADDDANAHEAAIDAAAAAGIVAGVAPERYDPAAPVDRIRMATFLARLIDFLADELDLEPPPPPDAPTVYVNAVHAVPAGSDPVPGISDAIRHELGLVDAWYRTQTGGLGPRWALDASGAIEVRTVTLDMSRSELEQAQFTSTVIESVQRAGVADPDDLFVIYVDVGKYSCGFSSGTYAFLMMASCDIYPSASTPGFPFGTSYLAAHELTHALGAVASCAPHHGNSGHVVDDNRDLLYAGPNQRDWLNLMLDPGRDDYYGHGRTACTDIAHHAVWAA